MLHADVIYTHPVPTPVFDALWNALPPERRELIAAVLDLGVAHLRLGWQGRSWLLVPDDGPLPGAPYPRLEAPTMQCQLNEAIQSYIATHPPQDVP